ncbi:Protein of unknown function [Pyronema omphalodes CBS 100304]|uniref:Uncharacterized protein n=1 Tax=Pyronema omphalodes (strain CBS 100304) TaxID=1076935 RepID=U4LVV5_PYROM|nr:Protein of unknown function [Pyronema omphalodes CBS 100304]
MSENITSNGPQPPMGMSHGTTRAYNPAYGAQWACTVCGKRFRTYAKRKVHNDVCLGKYDAREHTKSCRRSFVIKRDQFAKTLQVFVVASKAWDWIKQLKWLGGNPFDYLCAGYTIQKFLDDACRAPNGHFNTFKAEMWYYDQPAIGVHPDINENLKTYGKVWAEFLRIFHRSNTSGPRNNELKKLWNLYQSLLARGVAQPEGHPDPPKVLSLCVFLPLKFGTQIILYT